MDPYYILLSLGGLLILASLFEAISQKIRIPTVILLMSTGFLLQYIKIQFGIALLPDNPVVLQSFGIAGLIFIVLEEALHLKIEKEKISIISRSLISSIATLVVTTAFIAVILLYVLDLSLHTALAYAVPLAIMSSAVAIPSIKHFVKEKREFLGYEATFSDILGVLLFNYVVANEVFSFSSSAHYVLGFFLTFIVSLAASVLLLYVLGKIRSDIKSVVVFSALLALYSLGKLAHLSPLILILLFGLILGHVDLWRKLFPFVELPYDKELRFKMQIVTAEFSFFIRTMFFILFGYNMDFAPMLNMGVIATAIFILLVIYVVRYLMLWWILKAKSFVELFIAPRGLITIVLFYTLPVSLQGNTEVGGILSLVVLLTIVIMPLGLVLLPENEQEPEEPPPPPRKIYPTELEGPPPMGDVPVPQTST